MDYKFPARRQGNQWGARQQAGLKNSTFLSSNRSGTASSDPGSAREMAAIVGMRGTLVNQSAGGRLTGSGSSLNRKLPSCRPGGVLPGIGVGGGGGKGEGGSGGPTVSSEADRLFKLRLVEKSAEQVLGEKLKDVAYDASTCRDMSPEVASAIVERLRHFSLSQYKLVCVVSLGSLKQKPGVQFGSRCLWNKDTDSFVSVKYSNGSVYAVALIFGLYFE